MENRAEIVVLPCFFTFLKLNVNWLKTFVKNDNASKNAGENCAICTQSRGCFRGFHRKKFIAKSNFQLQKQIANCGLTAKKAEKRLKKRQNQRKIAIPQNLCNLAVAVTDKAQKRRKTPHFRPKMPEKCKKRTARQKCSEKSAVLPSAKPFRAGKPCPALLDFAALI